MGDGVRVEWRPIGVVLAFTGGRLFAGEGAAVVAQTSGAICAVLSTYSICVELLISSLSLL